MYDQKRDLEDSYRNHSNDSLSKALDDEADAYRDAQEKYIETLRDTLDFTEEILNEKIAEVLTNADIVLNEINTTADSYNVTVNPLLTSPWENASTKSLEFKTLAEGYLTGLINDETGIVTFATTATTNLKSPFEAGSEAAKLFASTIGVQLGTEGAGGYVVSFGTDNYGKLDTPFTSGNTAAGLFTSTVSSGIASVKEIVSNSTSPLTSNLKFPWDDTTKTDGPISTFSTKAQGAIEGALTTAQQKASDMNTALTSPWTAGGDAANTFADNVGTALDKAIATTKEKVKTLNDEAAKYNPPSYTGGDSGSDNTNKTPTPTPTPKPTTTYKNGPDVTKLQKILNQFFNAGIEADGKYGPATTKAVKAMQKTLDIDAGYKTPRTPDGQYDAETQKMLQNYLNKRNVGSWFRANNMSIPAAIYAKGTLGTKRDEFAITDESWIGEEITLAAGKNGQLQYLKKGSAVLPADISANLVEWGKINPDMSNISNGVHGVNLMSNYVSKPEINLTFDALVKADNITEDTLPEVKKFVQQEINNLVKQMNYALKGYSR